MDLLRDTALGQIIRWSTKGRLLKYPEEQDGFEVPAHYKESSDHYDKQLEALKAINERERERGSQATAVDSAPLPEHRKEEVEESTIDDSDVDLEKIATETEEPHLAPIAGADGGHLHGVHTTRSSDFHRVGTRTALSQSHTRAQLEEAMRESTLNRGESAVIIPTRLDDGTILVDWYTTDDPANPQNWSLRRKLFVTLQICAYTTAVYMGSSIYAPSEGGVMAEFGVNVQLASMGLSMYVLAYGIGPMLWSPLSEMPVIGRNPPYMITFAVFVILIIPSAVVQNFPGLIVLRFLQGFFGSPCLATGGASLQDMFSLIKIPYVLCIWAMAATMGPALGPIISGFSVPVEGWRWSMWELLWLAGPIWLFLFLCLPETSTSNILLRRANRLRKLTGDNRLKAQSEIDQANMKVIDLVKENLWRPNQMMILDPAVGFTAIYTALIYGIFYSFFEAFPLVYIEMYGFNLGQMGLTFLSISVGVILAIIMYWTYLYLVAEPDIRKNGMGAPERRLIPALYASFLLPIGLFIFGWSSNPTIHWIASIIGIAIFTIGIFIVMQCIFVYLPFTYPQYAASLFAGNDFTRSTLACAAIHFSRPLFGNLGIGRGCSLLAGLTCGCIGGVFALYVFGAKLRGRSRFAAK